MSFDRFLGGGVNSGFSRFVDPYSTEKLDQQISNANTRIQDAGYTPQSADSRNWFERMTNLPEHQNALFDTLELLGRPGNAVKNVIDKSIRASLEIQRWPKDIPEDKGGWRYIIDYDQSDSDLTGSVGCVL